MINKEAIEQLKLNLKGECLYSSEPIEIAIKALEKQVPKKVNIQQWMDTKCECGYIFSQDFGDGYYDVPYNNKTKYCPNCGQRLKWRDE